MCSSLELHRDAQLPELLVQLWRGLGLELRPRFTEKVSDPRLPRAQCRNANVAWYLALLPAFSLGKGLLLCGLLNYHGHVIVLFIFAGCHDGNERKERCCERTDFLQIKLRGKAVVELAPATKHPFYRNDHMSYSRDRKGSLSSKKQLSTVINIDQEYWNSKS